MSIKEKAMKILSIISLSILIFTSELYSFGNDEPLNDRAYIRVTEDAFSTTRYIETFENLNFKILRQVLPPEAVVTTVYKSSSIQEISLLQKSENELLRTFLVSIGEHSNIRKYCIKLAELNDDIELMEPLYPLQVHYTPNDPLLNSQQNMLNLLQAEEAWEIERGDTNIVIGVSDNGIDQYHDDLFSNIKINDDPINGVDDDNDGYIDNNIGYNLSATEDNPVYNNTFILDNHGTSAAGISSASFNNQLGIAGLSGFCKFFPIKIGDDDFSVNNTYYGYESLVYAAATGIDIINCSWGSSRPYSELQKSFVDYAVARGLLIVASAGNITTGQDKTMRFYPAAYDGVLGVGEVTAFDEITSGTSLGSHCQVMAPGNGNFTTDLNNSYSTFNGTSAAAPVVSGIAALVKSKYPDLNVKKLIAHIRQSTDSIHQDQVFYSKVIPGRINMLKAVNTDPYSRPGFAIEDIKMFDTEGNQRQYFETGDTVTFQIELVNYLGLASGLDASISVGYPESNINIEWVNNTSVISANTNESIIISEYEFVINEQINDSYIFRIDLQKDNYKDFLLFEINPQSEVHKFENNDISISVGNKGTIGYKSGYQDRPGEGIILKDFGDALYEGGLFVIGNDQEVVSSNFGSTDDYNDFKNDMPFFEPVNKTLFSAITNSTFLKFSVEQEVELPRENGGWLRLKTAITDSNGVGDQLSIGYFMDWDLGIEINYLNNYSELLESAKPSQINENQFAALSVNHPDLDEKFGIAVVTNESDGFAQAGAYDTDDNTNNSLFINTMNSGKNNISRDTSDIKHLIGIRFNEIFDQYESKSCDFCIAAGNNENELIQNLRDCLSGVTSIENNSYTEKVKFYDNRIEVISDDVLMVSVYDINGRLLLSSKKSLINLTSFKSGVYLIDIFTQKTRSMKKISIVR